MKTRLTLVDDDYAPPVPQAALPPGRSREGMHFERNPDGAVTIRWWGGNPTTDGAVTITRAAWEQIVKGMKMEAPPA